ncbi:MFS transporter [Streptomyces brasiliensis]|uniref:MFS transporter n=1 Tax=Streptomyces brasiliensis TaxID=1954 RepID=A0A917P3U0_9ACTN|nr:MFS transporter [Streptomyces brasiliensis]GGJ59839.1 MFS transporter [Streptomyces brasiliensis]
MAAPASSARPWRAEISRYQWAVLFATTLGWALDGFDSSLFTQVAGPATTDLLNRPSTFHAGLVVTLFLAGWAAGAILFGAIADYIGRVRVLIIGVLTYSVFTALAVFVTEYWQFAVVRFIAGIGSGVELPVGAALVAEAWNNRHRARASGVMMSGLAMGSLLSALVYYFVGGLGWRQTLAFGLVPALLALFIRRHIHEPTTTAEVRARRAARRQERAAGATKTVDDRFVLHQLFSRPLVGHTVACTVICCGALFAFWGVTTWTPQIIRDVVADHGVVGDAAVPYVSWATAALNFGGLLGYASWGFIADRIGRRRTYVMSLLIGIVGILALYPFAHSYTTYVCLLPVVGFGVFGVLSGNAVFFPELFGPAVRASAMAVTNSIGRFFTAAGPLVAGTIATTWFGGSLAGATTAVSMLIVIAFIGLWFTPETHGRFLYGGAPSPVERTSPPTDRITAARQPEGTGP